MPPTVPFWFKQRQCKADETGSEHEIKVTGPNLGEAYLRVERADNLFWRAALRRTPDGPDLAATAAEFPDAQAAWEAAFELFRQQVIV